MKISVVTRQPPRLRCELYIQFADAVADASSGQSELLYPVPVFPFPDNPLPPAPALLINGKFVAPSDGVTLSPHEICAAVVAEGFTGDAPALLQKLEEIQERVMKE